AEDGIRDRNVTGVQTCALPISIQLYLAQETMEGWMEEKAVNVAQRHFGIVYEDDDLLVVNKPAGLLTHPEKAEDRETLMDQILRSEERRVGKVSTIETENAS